MRPVDPRLLREAPAARRFLGLCVIVALASAAATVAQAVALGLVVAHVFLRHEPLSAQRDELVVLVAATVVRAALAWALESGGRITSLRVGAELRGRLVAHLLAARPPSRVWTLSTRTSRASCRSWCSPSSCRP